MSVFPSSAASPWLPSLKQEAVAWGTAEGWRWIFVFKSALAALLALWLAMRFQLDQPRLAMITVFIVMRPQTGMILTKSVYRIGGTLAGVMVSLLLVSLFAQEPVLFLLGLALWVGLCTVGAAFYRDFKSYGCVLAGYSAALAGLSAAPQPNAAFSLAVTRLSEVTLGILCAGVVSDIIFPLRLSDQITSNVQNRYVEFMAFVRRSLSGTAATGELEAMQMKLVGNVLALESIRNAAFLEDPEVRSRDLKLRKLNSEFMAASTTFYSFHQLLNRLTKNALPAGEVLTDIYDSLGLVLEPTAATPQSSHAAHVAARRIAAFRAVLARKVRQARADVPALNDAQNRADFETAIELLHRFLHELHGYTRTYATLSDKEQGPKPPDDIQFATYTDPVAALLTGGKAFVSILLISVFWIATAWPHGASALSFAAVTSALFGSAPDQYRGVRHMIMGHGTGYVLALLFACFIMPSLDGFTLLSMALLPFLMIGSYVITYPRWVAIGTGYVVFFLAMLSPSNPMVFNPVGLINDGSASLLGTAIAGLVFMTLVPATGAWFNRRMAGQIRRQVVMACLDPLSGILNRFESGTYDLLHKMESTKHLADDQNQRLVAWILSVREIGRAVIHVREDAAMVQMPPWLSDQVQESIRSTARLFRRLSARHREATLDSVTLAINSIQREMEFESHTPHDRDTLRRLLASLHLMRIALLDDETVLAAATGGLPENTTEEIANAA
ncbi:FUSC family protein [Geobacter argillaceus]|uniref:Putative membrane protein YccC n=1 Tax=Geobacter argillaceus TaxID=345631 RepID=A0A562VI37_9BACT|nr:FUSC family protein [Geobacter argillaceus]TWJ17585.1 putative membrane protein YccC [Geobacter argillaceus]